MSSSEKDIYKQMSLKDKYTINATRKKEIDEVSLQREKDKKIIKNQYDAKFRSTERENNFSMKKDVIESKHLLKSMIVEKRKNLESIISDINMDKDEVNTLSTKLIMYKKITS